MRTWSVMALIFMTVLFQNCSESGSPKADCSDCEGGQWARGVSMAPSLALMTYRFSGGFAGPTGAVSLSADLLINMRSGSIRTIKTSSAYPGVQQPCTLKEFNDGLAQNIIQALRLVTLSDRQTSQIIDRGTEVLTLTDEYGVQRSYVFENSDFGQPAQTVFLTNADRLSQALHALIEESCRSYTTATMSASARPVVSK